MKDAGEMIAMFIIVFGSIGMALAVALSFYFITRILGIDLTPTQSQRKDE